jgi:hypothetical protein
MLCLRQLRLQILLWVSNPYPCSPPPPPPQDIPRHTYARPEGHRVNFRAGTYSNAMYILYVYVCVCDCVCVCVCV